MQRVSVVGNSGSGKSTLARDLARRLRAPWVELDAVFHQPGWVELPLEDFRHRATELTEPERWVVDGNYTAVRDIVWSRADTVVWLDFPRWLVMRRIVGRSLTRVVLRRELWNGNRERWRDLVSLDPERSIIRWSWTQHEKYRARFSHARTDPTWSHLRFVRLCSPSTVAAFLAALPDEPLAR